MSSSCFTFISQQTAIALAFACCIAVATAARISVRNEATVCWLTFGGVCVRTGSDTCPFSNGWFSWLHCPPGYHCCAPNAAAGAATPPIDRHPVHWPCGNRTTHSSSSSSLVVADSVAMVIGGSAAGPGDWPWMAQILRARSGGGDSAVYDGGQHHCGGVLVHPEWVLSAGHCFAWADPSDSFSIRLGLAHSNESDGVQHFNASRILVHEKFFRPVYSNDIALVRLDRPVRIDAKVIPICLPEPAEKFDDSVGCVAGWGATSDSGTSEQLMQTQLPTITNSNCKRLYSGTNRPVHPENICAGFLAGERDACQGDSGGPLMVRRDGVWLAAGLVSHGEGCGVLGKPGIFTGVASYALWVRGHIVGQLRRGDGGRGWG